MAREALVVTIKHPKGEDGYRTFSVRLRESMVNQMDDISSQTGRSRNELISMFLAYALENYTLEGGDGNARSKRA